VPSNKNIPAEIEEKKSLHRKKMRLIIAKYFKRKEMMLMKK